MFVTACSPLTDHRVGNMTSLAAGGSDAVEGRATLIGWFILAALCLSPILTFFLDRQHPQPLSTAQAAVTCAEGWRYRRRSVEIDRQG
jgi:hypothetical protein